MGAAGTGDDQMPTPQWSELEQTLGHVFKKRSMLEQSVTHSSLAYERAMGRSEPAVLPGAESSHTALADEERDNEQLEFLGDAVLGMIVADYLFRAYPELQEGDLTRLRAQLVSRKHLGQVAAQISLGAYMRLGRGEERSGGRQKAVLLANAIEAVIAALYLDGGLKAATGFVVQSVVEPYIDELHAALEAGLAMGDHKSALQEWLQAHKAGSPQYMVKAESGPDHRKRFLVEVEVVSEAGTYEADRVVAQGMGSTKKKAEQEAARHAYAALLAAEHRNKDEEASVSPLAGQAS
jgi:ribonuclease-3